MKKILLLLSLAGTIGSATFAQTAKFGLKFGLNQATLSSSGSGSSSSSLTGFHAGAFVDFGLGDVSIQPAILYSVKGGTSNVSGSETSGGITYSYQGAEKLTLNYIEVPVNILYHVPVGVGKLFIGGGPYVAMGISGKDVASATASGGGQSASNSSSTDVTFGSASGDVKNPDYGINFLGGIAFKGGTQISLGYGLGLANLSNDSSTTIKNNVFSVSIGFTFL